MQRDALSHATAVERFVDAVVAFSDDPGPANLERYLEASRSLEESRRPSLNRHKPGAAAPRMVAQRSASPG